MQKYLPKQNQLYINNLPQEYYLNILGINIHIDHYTQEKPKGRVILFHGVGGNGRLLSFIALPFQQNGFEVVCPDLPLYGYTEYKGKITYDTWVNTGTEIVKHYQNNDNVKTFIFGLSAGGMLAYQVVCESVNISGLMLTCILDQRNIEITKRTAKYPFYATFGKPLMEATQKLFGNVKIPLKMISNMKAIANNKDLVDLLIRDKKCSGVMVPVSFIYTMMTPKINIEPENFNLTPLLLVHPENDNWTDVSLSRSFYDRLACAKELKILDGAGHFPIEEHGLKQMTKYCLEFLNSNL